MSVTFDMSFFFSECDIQYIDPSKYTPPDDGMPMRNGVDDDPYEKLVRGNLAKIEKQKVGRIKKRGTCLKALHVGFCVRLLSFTVFWEQPF